MPRCRWHVSLNPPGEFVDHAREVAAKFDKDGLVATHVEVVYGFGPSAEVRFTVDSLDAQTIAALVQVAESLRRAPTRAEVQSLEVSLTPEERDAAEGGGTLAAYDAPYTHE